MALKDWKKFGSGMIRYKNKRTREKEINENNN